MGFETHSLSEEEAKKKRALREGKNEFFYFDDERNIHRKDKTEPRIPITTTLPVALHQKAKEMGNKWNDFILYGIMYLENRHKYDYCEKELEDTKKEIELLRQSKLSPRSPHHL